MFIRFGNPELFDEFMQSLDIEVFETPPCCAWANSSSARSSGRR